MRRGPIKRAQPQAEHTGLQDRIEGCIASAYIASGLRAPTRDDQWCALLQQLGKTLPGVLAGPARRAYASTMGKQHRQSTRVESPIEEPYEESLLE